MKVLDYDGLEYYNEQIEDKYATKNSPALTGTPTAPTPTANDNSTKIATTAYVQAELADYATLNDLDDYLPLAGGTMTGNIIFNGADRRISGKNNTQMIGITAGTSYYGGGNLFIWGYDNSDNNLKGCFRLTAHDASNGYSLLGKPDGYLKWNGDNILISSNADNRILSGGTSHYLGICSGDTGYAGGGNAYFFGKDYADDTTLKGAFRITAKDNSNTTQLLGKPNGTLTWGDKAVIVGNKYTQTFSNVSCNANTSVVAGTLTYDPTYYSVKMSGAGYADFSAIVNTSNKNVYIRNNSSSNRTGLTVTVNYIVL